MSRSPHVLMIFLDGVGIGKKQPAINPFFKAKLPAWENALGGLIPSLRHCRVKTSRSSLSPIDATLGVEGLPQSGTGQTTLLTGFNAAQYVGKHFGPYPYSTLKPVIAENNIFKQLANRGKHGFYANAFPPKYFDYINSTKMRMTAISYSWVSAGFPLNTHETLSDGNALSADITAIGWNKKGFPTAPEITAEEGGKRLSRLTEEYDFVLFEYYLTDHAGHSQSMETATRVLETVDSLLEGIIETFDFKNNMLLLTSDHGNIEDLSTKSHTRNPVPLLVMGNNHDEVSSRIRSLIDVTPAIINFIG